MSAHRRLTFVILLGALLTFALGAPYAFGAVVLADSYSEGYTDAIVAVNANFPQVGQSFTAIAGTLDSATFHLSRTDTSTGSAYALLYAHSGTFGVSSVPSGPPLATSSAVDVTSIAFPGGQQLITFHFDNTVLLTAGEKYVIVVQYSGNVADPLWCGVDISAATHPGNFLYIEAGTWWPVSTYEAPFYVYVTPPVVLQPVYRFYNRTNGTHFYTDSAAERDMVNATWPHIFTDEGPTYYTNPANNSTQLIRLYNKVVGSHFYTSSSTESANALATWPGVFQLDGATYKVNPGPVPNSLPVYRFYNVRNGSHFYTASETEKAHVLATWPDVYTYEGPAFWIGQ